MTISAAFICALIAGFCVGTLIGLWRQRKPLRRVMELLNDVEVHWKNSRLLMDTMVCAAESRVKAQLERPKA